MDDGRYDNLPYGWDEEAFEDYWGNDDVEDEDFEEYEVFDEEE